MDLSNDLAFSEPQLTLAERFLAAYNAIDRHLREVMRVPNHRGFSSLVREYGAHHARWLDREGHRLFVFADLRNVLVHNKLEPYRYLAIPLPEVVEAIEAIRDHLLDPVRVLPTFQEEVVAITPEMPLSTVLTLIDAHGFSQFPVYAGDPSGGQFRGLLTENGITRWLAHYRVSTETIIELKDEKVAEVLAQEENRQNWAFVARDTPVDEVIEMFAAQPMLEAVLITHSGSPQQAPLGIITGGDILRLEW
jgi:predicted transcriptional regulator